MNKKNYYIAGILTLIVISGAVVFFSNNKPAKETKNESVTEVKIDDNKSTQMADGMKMDNTIETRSNENKTNSDIVTENMIAEDFTEFKPYSKDLVTTAQNKNIVLFFNASWCPTCKATIADINKNIANSKSNTLILAVDYDNSSELKSKYGITMQHTFVKVDTSMNQIKKAPALATLQDIIDFSK